VGCSHAAGCPLFPLLRESLRGWRDYYCDSNDQWLGCARYQMSLTGERVPISLLPNGAHARHFEDAGGTGRPGAAAPRQAERQAVRQAPSPQSDPWSAEGSAFGAQSWAAGPSAPAAPAAPDASAGHRVAGPETVTPWATAPPSIPLTQSPPRPAPASHQHQPPYGAQYGATYDTGPGAQPHGRSARHAPQASAAGGPKRGLWARFTDWMRRPA
jgi:hypothetical protein